MLTCFSPKGRIVEWSNKWRSRLPINLRQVQRSLLQIQPEQRSVLLKLHHQLDKWVRKSETRNRRPVQCPVPDVELTEIKSCLGAVIDGSNREIEIVTKIQKFGTRTEFQQKIIVSVPCSIPVARRDFGSVRAKKKIQINSLCHILRWRILIKTLILHFSAHLNVAAVDCWHEIHHIFQMGWVPCLQVVQSLVHRLCLIGHRPDVHERSNTLVKVTSYFFVLKKNPNNNNKSTFLSKAAAQKMIIVQLERDAWSEWNPIDE